VLLGLGLIKDAFLSDPQVKVGRIKEHHGRVRERRIR
jgi:hypothetical protein